MLIIAYPPDPDFLNRAPFACQPDPELIIMDRLLDDPKVVLAVANDLARSTPQALWNGRPSTPVVVTLRQAVLRRLMNWSYRTAEREIKGSLLWRWFCHIYSHPVSDHSTMHARERLIQPRTLHRLNDRVVTIAHQKGGTRGRKLRTDSAVIETNIHYPTDSALLADSVRVIGRTLAAARRLLAPPPTQRALFRNRTRQAQRLASRIANRLRSKGGQKRPSHLAEGLYRKLVKVTELTVTQAEQVMALLEQAGSQQALALAQTLAHYLPLVRRVIAQTRRRVLEHQTVPAGEKVVSLFEPHTAIIRRGKGPPHETEFGRMVWYSEVDGGIISEYRLLKGNPPDQDQWGRSVRHHCKLFGHPPEVATADRRVYSPQNEQLAHRLGVQRVALPQPGVKDEQRRAREAQPWFRAALRFRAGIEGRLSGLQRARGLDRCLNRGEAGLERWVGWGVITNNLVVMAAKLARRRRSPKALSP